GRSDDHDRVDPVCPLEPLQALGQERPVTQLRERLRTIAAEPLASTCCNENCPNGHSAGCARTAHSCIQPPGLAGRGGEAAPSSPKRSPRPAATRTAETNDYAGVATLVFFFELLPLARTPSSHSAASSSSMSLAYISSLARIFLALTNICFSPVERPFSWSRSARFRTTSASSKMSPVFILSRLCLKRRFQFFGICVPPPVSAFSTFATICSSITLRRPT